jgi:hypothetical protein
MSKRRANPADRAPGFPWAGSRFFILELLGGASRDRTGDLKLAKLALSQLSYGPPKLNGLGPSNKGMVGLGRFELPTSPLSGVRSNQLSYRPVPRALTGQMAAGGVTCQLRLYSARALALISSDERT